MALIWGENEVFGIGSCLGTHSKEDKLVKKKRDVKNSYISLTQIKCELLLTLMFSTRERAHFFFLGKTAILGSYWVLAPLVPSALAWPLRPGQPR